MRIAIAGGGALAKYFAEEFPKAGLEVVVLTRAPKPFFEDKPGVVAQRTTDYASADELAELLADCDALVSTIQDYSPRFVEINVELIEACNKSLKCKRFIPAEFGGDAEKYPDQPAYYEPLNGRVRELLLSNGKQLEWTVVCIGVFIEMFLPKINHHFGYIPDFLDAATHTIAVDGTGEELLSLTSARDVAKAVAQLLLTPQGSWRPYVYMEGHKTSLLHAAALLKRHVGDPSVQVVKHSLTQLINAVVANEDVESVVIAQIGISMLSGACTFDAGKVARDRAEYFSELKFRTIDEVYELMASDPQALV
ncbi:Isoflavone reductase [Globisporangium polare]